MAERLRFTEAQVQAKLRDPASVSLTHREALPTPSIVNEIAWAMFDMFINDLLHFPDETEEWNRLTEAERGRYLDNTIWLIGRLYHKGFVLRDFDKLKKARKVVQFVSRQNRQNRKDQ